VFENWVLRGISEPKRAEVIGGWRQLHNEELRNVYSSLNVTRTITLRRMRWVWHVARMEAKGNAHRISVGKPEGERQQVGNRHRWEGNIKMDIR
jgi:hypothetical protein